MTAPREQSRRARLDWVSVALVVAALIASILSMGVVRLDHGVAPTPQRAGAPVPSASSSPTSAPSAGVVLPSLRIPRRRFLLRRRRRATPER